MRKYISSNVFKEQQQQKRLSKVPYLQLYKNKHLHNITRQTITFWLTEKQMHIGYIIESNRVAQTTTKQKQQDSDKCTYCNALFFCFFYDYNTTILCIWGIWSIHLHNPICFIRIHLDYLIWTSIIREIIEFESQGKEKNEIMIKEVIC